MLGIEAYSVRKAVRSEPPFFMAMDELYRVVFNWQMELSATY